MASTRIGVATSRRMLLVGITALVALLAVSFSAPQDAHAIINPTTVTSQHTGWVYTRHVGVVCTMDYPSSYCSPSTHTAWRWSGYSWSRSSIGGSTQVYAYPYSGAWHWIWTQHSGWLAIETSKLETGYRCTGYRCPVF